MSEATLPIGFKIRHIPSQGKVVPEHCQVVFYYANGWSVSAVYGAATYSHNKTGYRFPTEIADTDYATTVEVAIFDSQQKMVQFKDGERVKGFATVAELYQILQWVSTR